MTRPLDDCPTGTGALGRVRRQRARHRRWTVLRPDSGEPAQRLRRHPEPADRTTARCTGPARRQEHHRPATPDGSWMATAKISATALNENYHQAGLRVWAGDDNWASVHMIYAGSGRDFEFITEANGTPRNEAADKLGGIPADAPLDVLRADRLRRPEPDRRPTPTTARRSRRRPARSRWRRSPTRRSARRRCPTRRRPRRWRASTGSASTRTSTGGGGSDGVVDDFEGTTLGSGWQRIRRDQSAVVSGGTCRSRPSRATSTRPATTLRT